MHKTLLVLSSLLFSGMVLAAPKMSASQTEQLQAQIQKPTPDAKINQAKKEAAQVLYFNIATHACLDGYDASVLNAYANVGKKFPAYNYVNAPMPPMLAGNEHERNQCLDVVRINNWRLKNNTLVFDATYQSTLSQKASKQEHKMVKQADGEWLIEQ